MKVGREQMTENRDAKASLSAVVDDAMQGKPAVITRHGKRQAVVVSYEEWQDCRMREQRGWRSMTEEGRAFTRKSPFTHKKQPDGQISV
jgi:prevent-host-death family protein